MREVDRVMVEDLHIELVQMMQVGSQPFSLDQRS